MTRSIYIPDDVAKKVEKLIKDDLTFNKIVTNALIQYLGLDRPKTVEECLDEMNDKFDILFRFKEQMEERINRS